MTDTYEDRATQEALLITRAREMFTLARTPGTDEHSCLKALTQMIADSITPTLLDEDVDSMASRIAGIVAPEVDSVLDIQDLAGLSIGALGTIVLPGGGGGGGGGGGLTFVNPPAGPGPLVGPGTFPIEYTLPPGLVHLAWFAIRTIDGGAIRIGGNSGDYFATGAFAFELWKSPAWGSFHAGTPTTIQNISAGLRRVWLGAIAGDSSGVVQPVMGFRSGFFDMTP